MASGGGEASDGVRHKRTYLKENTLIVNVVDNTAVKARDVIQSLTDVLGEGAVYTCVSKGSSTYEVTVADSDALKVAVCGVKVGEKIFECSEVVQETVVVSFIHMSGYIHDSDIELKLKELGVELVSGINRRLHPGTSVEDGTRFVRVKFPPTLSSLPYSMKFYNGKVWDHVRVIHNDQTKVCRQCMSNEHLFRDCPDFVCFKCRRQGHIARYCKEPQCNECGFYGLKCTCDDDSIDDCDKCGKSSCCCDGAVCVWCDKTLRRCQCNPEDICQYCSVEIQNCQCVMCEKCNDWTCSCVTDTVTQNAECNQPGEPRTADQPVIERQTEETATPTHDAERPGTREESVTVDGEKTTAAGGETTGPVQTTQAKDGKQPVKTTTPNESGHKPSCDTAVTDQPKQVKLAVCTDETGRTHFEGIVKRRKRIVVRPNIPDCARKKMNIDNDIELK